MLHLARIQRKTLLGKAELLLLARQRSEYAWEVIESTEIHLAAEANALHEGNLVLLDLDDDRVSNLRDATDWIVRTLGDYLAIGITPEQLQEEIERAEQWRQSLTLQSQEIGRRVLETEARRDQIQQLEENLKKEKEEIRRLEALLREKYQALGMDFKLERSSLPHQNEPEHSSDEQPDSGSTSYEGTSEDAKAQ